MSAPYDVADYIANVLGRGVLGVGVLCNTMPDKPDACISVYDYVGGPSVKGFGSDANPLEYPSVKICVRSLDPSIAESTAKDLFEIFDELVADTTINSTVYTWFHPLQPPYMMGRDGQERVIIGFNMDLERRRT